MVDGPNTQLLQHCSIWENQQAQAPSQFGQGESGTGRKWGAGEAVQQGKARLQHKALFGSVTRGRAGLGNVQSSQIESRQMYCILLLYYTLRPFSLPVVLVTQSWWNNWKPWRILQHHNEPQARKLKIAHNLVQKQVQSQGNKSMHLRLG